MISTKMLSILWAHEGLTAVAVAQGKARERWQMQEESRVGREIKETDAAWGRGRRKLAERERKSRIGRRGTAGARIYPQFQKIPWQCREGSTDQCSVSACLMGLRHHTRDILAVLAGSSAPSSRWPTWQPTWPRCGHSSLKGRCEVMVASGTCLLHPRGLFLWAHGISDWSLAGKAPSAWPPLPHPAAFRKRMRGPCRSRTNPIQATNHSPLSRHAR